MTLRESTIIIPIHVITETIMETETIDKIITTMEYKY